MEVMTYRIEVARAEGPAVLQHFVEALLHRGELIRLRIARVSGDDGEARRRTRTYYWHKLLRNRFAGRQKPIDEAITSAQEVQ